jgi:hypothetical protein
MLALLTDALVLISGNNFLPAGDPWRRLLTIRIDAAVEAPELRIFAIDPFEHCRGHRQDIVAAAPHFAARVCRRGVTAYRGWQVGVLRELGRSHHAGRDLDWRASTYA